MKIIECPRDAMQGIETFIPTQMKADYVNLLLKAGFDTIDFGSFVSPKAVPQMRDTADLVSKLDVTAGSTKLLAIVANLRGAKDASVFNEISNLGYPMSISETFQQRNTNKSIGESLSLLQEIQNLCIKTDKALVAYISMGFGNPYGDPWNGEIAAKWVDEMANMGISIIALADTIGVSNPENISHLFDDLIPEFPKIEFGAHLHSAPDNWEEKIAAADKAGCRRFDSALKGYGGCPMAEDELVGNIATENLLHYFASKNVDMGLDESAFTEAMQAASEVFP